ncbi:MFS transporter [Williamsia sterculiae]|uniref:Sugar phosphate permease n=1 Tax=Williamsia sterculiae TaxID=1344003 RepID=A0A1N7GNV1_9NOCA|nr:MFS transporter [Williamsia sterculiae]SIS14255.1 Sugar phosphate permease [Williamsia sterculiae]
MRVWTVWAVGVCAYIAGVLQRTTFGVVGVDAAHRFGVNPGVLATFVVLQVLVYAAMQLPAGVLLDRFGSRAMIATGAVLMGCGQFLMATTDVLVPALIARVVLGVGDGLTFIAVLRLVPRWFPVRRVPMMTQLTGILGQGGQVLSAVPFLAIMNAAGWSTAFTSAGALGLLMAVLVIAVVRDHPPGTPDATHISTFRDTIAQVPTVWRRTGTKLGFFTHMGTPFPITVFALLWGVPYLTTAQGMSRAAAGSMLTISVAAIIAAGLVIGALTGRYPLRRSVLVLGIIGGIATAWTVLLLVPGRAPIWLLVLVVVISSVGAPGSTIGFDYARTHNPRANLGTAQGIVNVGGFLAALLVMLGMGLVLTAAGGFTATGFRIAWSLQYVIWLIAVVGILRMRGRARRELVAEGGVLPRPLIGRVAEISGLRPR